MGVLSGVLLITCGTVLAMADLRPDKIQVADGKKTQAYVRDGLVIGGDKAIDEVLVKDIRRAANQGFERIVVDLAGNHNGEAAAIERPPYYQISVTPDEKRLVFTVWGHPKLSFDPKRVQAAFKESSVVERVQLFPVLDEGTWTFVFELKSGTPVEIFELSNPVRIIMDVKTPKVAALPRSVRPASKPTRNTFPAVAPGKEEPEAEVAPPVNSAPGIGAMDPVPVQDPERHE
ncbi:MAG: hypothetical protein A2428_00750 [Bdellovibrionales bacterium RIFOXYC1_FULL_54_43]|nr:MAG: hypothetical protein A2428_00750 [Bdellovibrionales bacterium RIFOXYC1_FULL_54_43]OFZ85420.1 MAG: hypothetical protein A2603_00860 [Bdellovibrionales bacterium RIFOXYD1_FULL_55_31]